MLKRLAALAAGLMLTLAPAAAQEKIKFTLDWKIQGIHAWYYWAADKGYFKAEGLDVTHRSGRRLGRDRQRASWAAPMTPASAT